MPGAFLQRNMVIQNFQNLEKKDKFQHAEMLYIRSQKNAAAELCVILVHSAELYQIWQEPANEECSFFFQ